MIYEMIIMRFPRLTVQSSSLIPAGQAVQVRGTFSLASISDTSATPRCCPKLDEANAFEGQKGFGDECLLG